MIVVGGFGVMEAIGDSVELLREIARLVGVEEAGLSADVRILEVAKNNFLKPADGLDDDSHGAQM